MSVTKWYSSGNKTKVLDLEVFYQRAGEGPLLFCIHGFPSSSWDFEPIWPALSKRFEVVAHDLIGLGKSAKPKQKLTVSLQADIVEALATTLGVKEAHLLAHDLGDSVAQELLARQSEGKSNINWLSCVLLNGGLFPETHRALLTQKILLSPLGSFVARLMSKRTLSKSFIHIFSKAHPPTASFIDETWKLIEERNGKAMIPRLIHYMNERKTNRERWVQPLVDTIIPIRLINGIEDPVSGKHMADRFAQLVPNADIVHLENSGHYPHIETPEEVLDAFFQFHDQLVK